MASPRVYADFQNLDDENRLRLTCAGTRRDQERQGIKLHEGMTLTLYTDDARDDGQPDELWAEGVVHLTPGRTAGWPRLIGTRSGTATVLAYVPLR
jgi:hypothetical protein